MNFEGCTWDVPPFGTSNVKINGVPLPANSTSLTFPSPTTSPDAITNGYSFNLGTTGAKTLQYDITTLAQRNSLYIFAFDYELVGDPTTWYFQFTVDKDVGGQLQVSLAPTYPMVLSGTSGTPKRVYIPFFVNGCVFKTVLSIICTPTATTSSAVLKMTNIIPTEASNGSMTDAQICAMLENGYNLDFYGVGQSLFVKGPNRKVYPVLDATSGRTTEVPTAGTWLVGDEMVTLAPAASGHVGRICTTAGTPGVWKTYGAVAA